ncbi:PsiF family protein [Bradyrhizobium sp. WSM1743]|uniref:PsiF family protein n=1 Tax=Bradyrhizobium sp. WSM1743 TaxID=318996 RepID=UPI0004294D45|nr:PsiF family protein [Bradyrhizobium sp. WSM1743]
MTLTSRLAAAALASLLVTGTAFAQTAAPAAKTETKTETKTDAAATTDKKAPKERSAESLECSKQADAKGLKGKERKKFRRECMKEAKAGTAAPAAPAADKK